MQVLGIDACRGRWLAVVLDENGFVGAAAAKEASGLGERWPDVAAIAVDIPIGLPETPLRDADREARAYIGDRRSAVFPTFPAVVLEAPTYEQAKSLAVARGWPRPSLQSYGMRHRVAEIAAFAADDERVFEVHPEVSFRELAQHSLLPKRTAAGVAERRQALATADISLPDLPYPVEDVHDAAVAAWSALRYARGEAVPLPDGYRARIGAIWR